MSIRQLESGVLSYLVINLKSFQLKVTWSVSQS